MIIGTTSNKDVLHEMGMLSTFSAVIHISNISHADHLMGALEDLSAFPEKDLKRIASKVQDKRWKKT